jgi:ketosteroid isomerase-like protein
MKRETSVEIACNLWHFFNEMKWDEARELLDDNLEVYWNQSREKIIGADNFIKLNSNYPGTHKIQVLNSNHSYDRWDKVDKVVTQTQIKSTIEGKELELFAISLFDIRDNKIISAVEYWADSYPAPEWRKQYVEYY